ASLTSSICSCPPVVCHTTAQEYWAPVSSEYSSMRPSVSIVGMMPKASSASMSAVATVWMRSEPISSTIDPLSGLRPSLLLSPPMSSAESTSMTHAVPLGKTNRSLARSSSTAAGTAVSCTTELSSSPGIRASDRCPCDTGTHTDRIDVSNPVRVEEWEVTDPPPAGTGPSAHRGDLDVGIRGEHVLVLADHLPDDLHGQPAHPGVLV